MTRARPRRRGAEPASNEVESTPAIRRASFSVSRSASLALLAAIALGVVAGARLGPAAAPLGEAALLYVKILKVLATPLVFVAIVDTVRGSSFDLRSTASLLVLSSMNAIVACGIALGLMHLAPLDHLVDGAALRALAEPGASAPGSVSPVSRALVWTGKHLVEPLQIGNLLYVVAAAVVAGFAWRVLASRAGSSRRASARAEALVAALLAFLLGALGFLARLVPLAAFGIVAKIAGAHGLAVLPALGTFVLLVLAGMALHVFGWYPVLLRTLANRSPRAFYRDTSDATLTALSAGSSLASLPVTLRVLDRLGVSRTSARLSACLGTNLNHDGIILYEAVAALFVAHVAGVTLGAGGELKVVLTSIAAAVGIAGVPEAGLMTLSLVLGAAGLPLGAVPLLMPVDWLLGRFRAATNVVSDMVVATVLDHRARSSARTERDGVEASPPSEANPPLASS